VTHKKEKGMKRIRVIMAAAGAMLLAACGVPREAGTLAAQEAAAATAPADDAAVRQRLQQEAAAWSTLGGLLQKRELGGITGVDAGFVQLVQQTAALAKRQNDLITQGHDDAAMNRESLEHFNQLWQGADRYLNQ
jgi:hypothetical protein